MELPSGGRAPRDMWTTTFSTTMLTAVVKTHLPGYSERESMRLEWILLSLLTPLFASGAGTNELDFAQAVQSSLTPSGKHTNVVITVHKDGSTSIGARRTSLKELEGVAHVQGLPHPPAVMIDGHRQAKHSDIRAVMDALTKSGIWRINFRAVEETSRIADVAPSQTSIVDTNRVAELVNRLGNSDFQVREGAEQALREFPASASAVLAKSLDSPDPEVAVRIKNIIAHIRDKRGQPTNRAQPNDRPPPGMVTRERLERMRQREPR